MPKPASPQFLATLGRALDEGVALQRQGKLADAEKIYTRILKTLPDQFDALQLLAEVKMQRGKAGEAFVRDLAQCVQSAQSQSTLKGVAGLIEIA